MGCEELVGSGPGGRGPLGDTGRRIEEDLVKGGVAGGVAACRGVEGAVCIRSSRPVRRFSDAPRIPFLPSSPSADSSSIGVLGSHGARPGTVRLFVDPPGLMPPPPKHPPPPERGDARGLGLAEGDRRGNGNSSSSSSSAPGVGRTGTFMRRVDFDVRLGGDAARASVERAEPLDRADTFDWTEAFEESERDEFLALLSSSAIGDARKR